MEMPSGVSLCLGLLGAGSLRRHVVGLIALYNSRSKGYIQSSSISNIHFEEEAVVLVVRRKSSGFIAENAPRRHLTFTTRVYLVINRPLMLKGTA